MLQGVVLVPLGTKSMFGVGSVRRCGERVERVRRRHAHRGQWSVIRVCGGPGATGKCKLEWLLRGFALSISVFRGCLQLGAAAGCETGQGRRSSLEGTTCPSTTFADAFSSS